MGLDNTIKLRTRNRLNLEYAPEYIYFQEHECEHGGYEYDVVYFRGSWAFRSLMYAILAEQGVKLDGIDEFNGGGEFDFPATAKSIRYIQEGLYRFLLNPDDWDRRSRSFMMVDEYQVIALDIMVLSWLATQLDSLPGCYFVFEDSW